MMGRRFPVFVVATAIALAVGGCGNEKSGSPAGTTPAATGQANGGNGPLSPKDDHRSHPRRADRTGMRTAAMLSPRSQ